MTDNRYTDAKKTISEDELNFETVFALSKICLDLLANKETEDKGRDLIIRILDKWDKIPESTHVMWNDIIEAAGLYPYTKTEKLNGSSLLRQEFHRSDFLIDKFLHAEQMSLSNILLNTDQSLIISAPTSFGKSLLIEEIVASNKYKNIVVIQPTLALLDETRKKLQKYSKDYNIIVSTKQVFSTERPNLFLFTGERVVEYPDFPKIDFFVVDEFYKLSMDRDDERAVALNEAVYRLLKITKKFYMLGPNIKSISEGFSETYNAHWEKTNFATVSVDVEELFNEVSETTNYTDIVLDKDKIIKLKIDDSLWSKVFTELEKEIYFKNGAHNIITTIESKSLKRKLNNLYVDAQEQGKLFNLLLTLDQPTLIYCSSPDKTFHLVTNFISFLKKRNLNNLNLSQSNNIIIDWIKENIDKNWILAKALEYSTGIHNGIIPRHLSSSIVDAFNSGKIRYLFCTSTLIEGVNTSAKNVVLFDKTKGQKPIDYFDFKNIVGRTGRMNKHFVGKVFQFHKEPKQTDVEVDIPLFTQSNAPAELLIQIDQNDIKESVENKLTNFKELTPDIQSLIRKNKGISIDGQLKILAILERDFDKIYGLINWKTIPTYEQLSYVTDLLWSNLIQKNESKGGVRSSKQLATYILQYCSCKSVQGLIAQNYNSEHWTKLIPEENARLQQIICVVLQAAQHWFNYKFPKLIAVASELQKYICEKKNCEPGDYSALSAMVENNFTPKHLAVLSEYGIPASAINKIATKIKSELTLEELINQLTILNLNEIGLLPYEIMKINSLIDRSPNSQQQL